MAGMDSRTDPGVPDSVRKMEKVNQKSLPERTADSIMSMLHHENYGVGQKLPNEIRMAERFEVSRSTIRQAEKILEQRGILDIERGAGTFVSGSMGMNEDPLGFSLIYDKTKLARDLLELRLLIEPKSASLAAQNAKRQDTELLFRLCDELEAMVAAGENYVRKDMEFHQAVANCSQNAAIHNLIPYIHQMLVLHDSISTNRHMEETVKEHRRIARAIAQRRGADAYDAMEYHLMVIRSRLMEDW